MSSSTLKMVRLHPTQVVDRLRPSQTIARFRTTSMWPHETFINATDMRQFGVSITPPKAESVETDKMGEYIHVYRFEYPQPQTIQMLESKYNRRRLPERILARAYFFNSIKNVRTHSLTLEAEVPHLERRENTRIWNATLALFAELKRLGAHLSHADMPRSLEEFNKKKLESDTKMHVDTELRATFCVEGVSLTLVKGGALCEGSYQSDTTPPVWKSTEPVLGLIAELMDEKMYDSPVGNGVMRDGLRAIIERIHSSALIYFGEDFDRPLTREYLPISFENNSGTSKGLVQPWGIVLDESALAEVEIPDNIGELPLRNDIV